MWVKEYKLNNKSNCLCLTQRLILPHVAIFSASFEPVESIQSIFCTRNWEQEKLVVADCWANHCCLAASAHIFLDGWTLIRLCHYRSKSNTTTESQSRGRRCVNAYDRFSYIWLRKILPDSQQMNNADTTYNPNPCHPPLLPCSSCYLGRHLQRCTTYSASSWTTTSTCCRFSWWRLLWCLCQCQHQQQWISNWRQIRNLKSEISTPTYRQIKWYHNMPKV